MSTDINGMLTSIGAAIIVSFALGFVIGTRIAIIFPKLFCKLGCHPVVEEGGGTMGDSLRCLHCDRERYPETFGDYGTKLPIEKVRKLTEKVIT